MKKIIIRLDDISWDMNYDKFTRLKDMLCEYGVRPIIGVIPENRDEQLKKYKKQSSTEVSQVDFWKLIKKLQDKDGWEIALHGCYHVYTTGDAGILRLNKRSEFAGVKSDIQKSMVSHGKSILEKHGLNVCSFMAPAHSFDRNTIEALKDNRIYCITDGYALYPYKKYGCLFVPQVNARFSTKGMGYATICIHVNEWDEKKFRSFEKFVEMDATSFVSFTDVINDYEKTNNVYWIIINFLFSAYYKLRRLLSKIRHGSKYKS